MKKNFGAKTWMYPLPVLIVNNGYLVLEGRVGNAFSDGAKID